MPNEDLFLKIAAIFPCVFSGYYFSPKE
jgi:hypothetical protein